MTPVIVDRGRFDLRIPRLRADRLSGQAVLVGLLAIAFVAIVLGRPAGDSGVGPLGNIVSASPATGVAAATEPGAATSTPAQGDATQTPAPTIGASATTEPSIGPSQAPSATPSPTTSGQPASSGATYRVKSGDTLSGIAKHFGTTTRVLASLNGITDASKIRIGQILRLP
jgi:LysM repeat protein